MTYFTKETQLKTGLFKIKVIKPIYLYITYINTTVLFFKIKIISPLV